MDEYTVKELTNPLNVPADDAFMASAFVELLVILFGGERGER